MEGARSCWACSWSYPCDSCWEEEVYPRSAHTEGMGFTGAGLVCQARKGIWKMVGLAGCCARSAREGKDRGENTGFTAAGLLRQAKEGIRKMVGLQREVPAWHKRLSERLGGDVHMVGPTISCEGTPRDGGPAAEWRTLPHVQSHAIAVDQVLLTHLSANLWVILPSPVCIVKVAHAAACALTCHRLQ